VYADASGEVGWMAWALHGDELVYVEGEWSAAEREGLIICEKELLASTLGLVALATAPGSAVLSFTDNTVALAAMRSMSSRSRRMQQLIARRTEWLYEHGIAESAAWITSAANLWADWGSRGRLCDVLAAADAAGLATRRVGLPAGWRSTEELLAVTACAAGAAAGRGG
jgi:hypothetical protein